VDRRCCLPRGPPDLSWRALDQGHDGRVPHTPEITEAMIARRAFELSLTDASSTPEENSDRARRELAEEAARQSEEAPDAD
jgi:hypothetical protein